MKSPKFSIIIPVYNVAPYLRECLDSVLAQTYTDWEAICVDDGSTDGSGAILDEYAAQDSRLRVIHQANAGVSAARNAALDVALGDWLWFVDGDDLVHPKALSLLACYIDDPQYSLLHAIRINYALGPGDGVVRWDELNPEVVYETEPVPRVTNYFFNGAWMVLFKRRNVIGMRFDGYAYNEDALYSMQCIWRGRGWMLLNARLYFYRQREDSACHKTISADKVAKIFESENRLLDVTIEGAQGLSGCDCRGLYKGLHNRMWFTYEQSFFKLDLWDRHRLLPEWLKIQKRFIGLYGVDRRRMCKIWILNILRSAVLAKRLVVGKWI